ncbi:DUF3500 domain-containing protein [Hymenobacter sp. GOD-10R]|uniref:DUF3500 domain-containing protein n=1 Tax=Hymenobacter sp. GOD-10R TaxID=3093922 RepID=UPI002D795CEF|nr:DUF3500 domain-containing protein [Hymenobacter sp. GOD-10R]WRQ31702.1 DUF3500 domain-containing protein [Hymenobacter sp. GOD-10R]
MKYPALLCSTGLLLLPALFTLPSQVREPAQRPANSLLSGLVATDCSSAKGLNRVICLTEAFKATLTPSQLAAVQRPYSKADAVRWSNFPQAFSRPQRVGLNFGSLNATQLVAAKALMAAVLVQGVPNEGYEELEGGLAADTYLGEATQQTDTFGAGNFYLALLGTPSLTGLWELQYGGHHYAFANTYKRGNIAGVTPSFRGVEPMTAVIANGKAYQPMEQERQAFAALLGSLSSQEQSTAKLSSSFRDVLLGPGRDGHFPATRQGLRLGELSATQQQLAIGAVKRYVNDLDPATAAPVLAKYTAELADTYLAYVGSGTMSQANDYIRLDGPNIWLEYSAQPSRDFPGTIHPHSVWRDRTSDYGGN